MPAVSILRNPEAVQNAVARSASIKEALEFLGLRAAGGNYRSFRQACARLGLEVPLASPLPPKGRPFAAAVPDAEVFCEDSRYLNRGGIKRRLLRRGLPEQCAICQLGPEWHGLPLALHLDHINGVFNDNRIENLRLLCPNCHSQTETYAGKVSSVGDAGNSSPCPRCAHANRLTAQRCSRCKHWLVVPQGHCKIVWPEDELLQGMVGKQSLVAVGAALGVSDTAVRKRLQSRGLPLPIRASCRT